MKYTTTVSEFQMRLLSALAGLLCLSMPLGVYAEQHSKPCAEDAAKLCKGIQQGEGRIARCLNQHSSELSPACKENMGEMKEKIRDFAQACKADKEKLCRDTKPGEGRILRCLKQHEDALSPACKEQMEQSRKRSN